MSQDPLCFGVDTHKLAQFKNNFLKSSAGVEAIQSGALSGEERLFLALMDTGLLNANMLPAQKQIIKAGEQFDEAYFITSGEVLATRGDIRLRLGAGAVLGLAEGMVGLPSRFSLQALTALQVKIIPFHKVDNIVHQLPGELKSILVTIIKRNLTVK
jgi:CRP-like cAMP-binding protein